MRRGCPSPAHDTAGHLPTWLLRRRTFEHRRVEKNGAVAGSPHHRPAGGRSPPAVRPAGGNVRFVSKLSSRPDPKRGAAVANVEAHITGTVWKIEVEVGDTVEEGDTVVILESMKMEMPVEAEDEGRVPRSSARRGSRSPRATPSSSSSERARRRQAAAGSSRASRRTADDRQPGQAQRARPREPSSPPSRPTSSSRSRCPAARRSRSASSA